MPLMMNKLDLLFLFTCLFVCLHTFAMYYLVFGFEQSPFKVRNYKLITDLMKVMFS